MLERIFRSLVLCQSYNQSSRYAVQRQGKVRETDARSRGKANACGLWLTI